MYSFQELAAKCQSHCLAIAAFTETPSATTRTFLSAPMRDCHSSLARWMREIGMQVRIDSIGNLRGLWGDGTKASRLVLGSHLDTVPRAGAYDGVLGVCLALAIVEATKDLFLPFDVEVIGFSEEEGVRFRKPFLGSLAAIGELDPAILNLRDAAGITVSEAIQAFGLEPAHITEARIDARTFAFLEFHIEQGPVLEQAGESIAPVISIAGQSRWELVFSGKTNHAGTTPMEFRRDALIGAAQWITEVEELSLLTPGLVATVGRLEVSPNAGNVIPGQVRASLDVRHSSDETRLAAVDAMLKAAEHIALGRGLVVNQEELLHQAAVSMDKKLVTVMEKAIHQIGEPARRMVSGAGHDAMIMARKVPSAMLFLRSPGGISHHPDESIRLEDVEKAIHVGSLVLSNLPNDEGKTV